MNKNDCCHGKHGKQNCGEFKGTESKEEKLKHLTECKKDLLNRIEQIDNAIMKIEKE
ncbi:MAG: hypothetical protein ACFFDW_07610 [Candidatus Thorarchaeota archaeon]